MASNYPGSLDSFDAIAVDKKQSDAVGGRTHRDMHNDLGDAVESIQGELGTNPSGSYDTVKARFEAIEGSTLPQVDAKGDLIVGTADNTYDNLGVGTNDTVLLAASGETKGVKWAQVPTAAIQDDAVTAAKIAANAVGSSELADNAVDTAAIQDSAVTSAKIADGTIVNADINASAAIARSKISGLPTSSTDNTIVRFDSTAGAMQTSGVVIDDNNRLTVATGATGGYGFASGAVHLSGTGSPEGVVTAAPGSTWLQTDATTDVKGWIRWVKATGTGNTGWVAGPEADTGWRDVSASLTNGWSVAAASSFRIRRIGNTVFFRAHIQGGTVGAAAYAAPSGFRPYANEYFACTDYLSAAAIGGATWTSGGTLIRNGANGASYPTVVVATNDAWPTSLPGSAA